MKAISEREIQYMEQLEGRSQTDEPLIWREECGGKNIII